MKSTKKCVLVSFDRYERLTQSHKNHQLTSNEPVPFNDVITEEDEIAPSQNKLDDNFILLNLPKYLHSRARTLLGVVSKSTILGWNDKGELTVKGNAIPHSHIADLLKDSLVTYKHFKPIGATEFYSNLSNIPVSLIRNPERRQLIQEGKGDVETEQAPPPRPPPPPGIPAKRKTLDLFKKPGKKQKTQTLWQELWTEMR